MTEQTDPREFGHGVEADLADPAANVEPAEGGRDEVDDVPGADTAGDDPAGEEPRDH